MRQGSSEFESLLMSRGSEGRGAEIKRGDKIGGKTIEEREREIKNVYSSSFYNKTRQELI